MFKKQVTFMLIIINQSESIVEFLSLIFLGLITKEGVEKLLSGNKKDQKCVYIKTK